ncbi:Histidinol dehydrogenase [Aestuariimicrobium sp. T2.26MG-19.2B]|uniref:histidinol dehydrogenase n=1 Tax=Aestuariimicrobium sp. T2.26MG-19.2B TaxID=3040679 RepID=UPI0024779349|nr:histidinol dehydrogenase [Aestuariimicrobium sp. T2.26MG-19.2B]CAI9410138.1 Histidinol dehydrogenase [Aestuariimicrobium sp. T2.26MG-19.2B]
MRTLDLRDRPADLTAVLPRAEFDVEHAVEQVRPIIDAVRDEGRTALIRFSEQFDGIRPPSLRVPAEVLERCAAELDDDLRAAFDESIARRRAVCELGERERSSETVEVAPGAKVTQRIIPVDRVGLYVPGGLAPLASSVIMNVVPAQVAKVRSIAVASPPQKDFGGLPHPNILGLCHLLGVDEVYAVGGAQAIAMFALGVEGLCDRVDMVTGPGNIYVAAAKRLLRGAVGIDAEAGPTEIAILADHTANPVHVAADLISQAEHDPMAASVLVTDSEDLARAVEAETTRQVALTPQRERVTTALTGQQSAIVLVADLDQGLDVVNAYAAEHLEIQTEAPESWSARVRNAGAIFVGAWSPVSLGDYSAGSTHVLPTAGCACHSSGLGVRSFMKAVQVIQYNAQALADVADRVETFARAENLHAHAAAITVRREQTR